MHTPFCSLPRKGFTSGQSTGGHVSVGRVIGHLQRQASVGYADAAYHVGAAQAAAKKKSKARPGSAATRAAAAKKEAEHLAAAKKSSTAAKKAEAAAKSLASREKSALNTALHKKDAAQASADAANQTAAQQAAQAAQGGGSGSGGGGDSGGGAGPASSPSGYPNPPSSGQLPDSGDDEDDGSFASQPDGYDAGDDLGNPGLGYDPNASSYDSDAADGGSSAPGGALAYGPIGTPSAAPSVPPPPDSTQTVDPGTDSGDTDTQGSTTAMTSGYGDSPQASGAPPTWTDNGDGTATDPTGSFTADYATAWDDYDAFLGTGAGLPDASQPFENQDGGVNVQTSGYVGTRTLSRRGGNKRGGRVGDYDFFGKSFPDVPASWGNDKYSWAKYVEHGGPLYYPGTHNLVPPPAQGYGPETWAHKLNWMLATGARPPAKPLRFFGIDLPALPASWGGDTYSWAKFVVHGGPVNPSPPPPPSGYGPELWAKHLKGEDTTNFVAPHDWHLAEAVANTYDYLVKGNPASKHGAWYHAKKAQEAADHAVSLDKKILREIRLADGTIVQTPVTMTPFPPYGTQDFSYGSQPNLPVYDATQDPQSDQYDPSQDPGTLGYGPVSGDYNYSADISTQPWTPPTSAPLAAPCPPGWTDRGDGTCADPSGSFGMTYAAAWAYYNAGGASTNSQQVTESWDGTNNDDGAGASAQGGGYADGGYGGDIDDGSDDAPMYADDGSDSGSDYASGGYAVPDGDGGFYNSDDQGAVDQSAAMDGNY